MVLGIVLCALAQVDTAWVRRYDGPGQGSDLATGIVVDSAGNVYVIGGSTGIGTGEDYVTIKYRPNGDTAWVRREEFPGNDRPFDLAVDGQGNVYVTGYGDGRIATVKYDSSGQRLWLKFQGGGAPARDLALDREGNVYICGDTYCSNSNWDFMTIKYRPNGEVAWVRTRDGAGYEDLAIALAASPQDRVSTVGQCWHNVGGNYLTILYDSLGLELWHATYDGPERYDLPVAVAFDLTGNVIVTGSSEGSGAGWDYLTIKYNPKGETCWVRRYNGPANGRDKATAVTVDDNGSVIVTGYSRGQDTDDDYATIKYSPKGETCWVRRYNGPANGLDQAFAIAVDQQGNAYVTGGVRILQNTVGCVTIKYDPDGDTVWTATYKAPAGVFPNYGIGVTVDSHGCVYVAGIYDYDIVTIKYVQGGGVEEHPTPEARGLTLAAKPNPFRGLTGISLQLPAEGRVKMQVFDVSGRLVKALVNGLLPAGVHSFGWNGSDLRGQRVPAGVYIIVLSTPGTIKTTKVTVLE